MRVRVKICCIKSKEEAKLAIHAGADALGLVSAMPSGPGVIGEALIANIAATTPPPVATFLLTAATNADSIVHQHQVCRTNTLQLVEHIDVSVHHALRLALPDIKLVQVVHVLGEESIDQAMAYAAHVDALLLDSGNPGLSVKELGGTGRIHNWAVSREIVKRSSIPVFLAGGLKPSNVAEAIREVMPFGLDLCSGVRTEGRLDANLLRAFMDQVATA